MRWGLTKGKYAPRLYSPSVLEFFDQLWRMTGASKMREVIREGAYGVLPPGDSYDDILPITFLRATEMKPNLKVDIASCHRVAREYFNPKARANIGDVLLAVKGATIASSKCVALIEDDPGEVVVNGSIFRMRFKESVNPKFAAVVLDTPLLKQQMRLGLVANNGVDYLDKTMIHSLVFPVPSIEKQHEIISIYEAAAGSHLSAINKASEILAGIDDYLLAELGIHLPPESENTLASRIFNAQRRVLEQRFDPAYFGFRFARIQYALESMPHIRLRDVAFFSSEQWDQEDEFGEEFPYLEISAIDTRTGEIHGIDLIPVNDAPSRARMLVREVDILVSTTRPNRGAITLVGSEIQTPLVASTGFSVIRYVDESRITKEFLLILLRSRLCLLQFEQRSSGGNYPAITQSELGRVLLPSVSLDIQRIIVAHVQRLQTEAKRLRQQAETELEAAKRRIEALLLGDTA